MKSATALLLLTSLTALSSPRFGINAAGTVPAAELAELGVGRVRFENRTSARTRIEVVTEGMLTRGAELDPFLGGVGVVILDDDWHPLFINRAAARIFGSRASTVRRRASSQTS